MCLTHPLGCDVYLAMSRVPVGTVKADIQHSTVGGAIPGDTIPYNTHARFMCT